MNFGWVLEGELAGAQGPARLQDLLFLRSQGVGAIIRMDNRTMVGDGGGKVDLVDMYEPVRDFTAPSTEQVRRMIEFVDTQAGEGRSTVVTCFAGIGRTGTVLACYLVHRGWEPREAVQRIRELRPGSIETPGQVAAVYQYAEWADDKSS